ncbi:flavodoxin family protein [Pseudonocardia benzenivorans]
MAEFSAHASVTPHVVRLVDHDVKPGVEADMGAGDEWPEIRDRIRAADILVVATPTWLGHMSSVAQRMLERLDAELSETDDDGRPVMFGKVAAVVADLRQSLNDIGFGIPAQGSVYWNGGAMSGVDYKDLDKTPEPVATATATPARNTVHLAGLLGAQQYPANG